MGKASVGVALIAAAFVVATANAASPASTAAGAGVQSQSMGAPVVDVVVIDEGQRLTGADVSVQVLPTGNAIDQRVTMKLPELALTDRSNGAFSALLPGEARLDGTRWIAAGGLMTLNIRVSSGDRVSDYATTVQRVDGRWIPAMTADQPGDHGVPRIAVDLADSGQTTLIDSSTGERLLTTRTARAKREPYCWEADKKYTVTRLGRHPLQKFARIDNWRGAKGKVILTSSSTHTTGSAIDYKYKDSGWQVSGSQSNKILTRESQSGVVDKQVYNRVNLARGRYHCTTPGNKFTYYVRLGVRSIYTALARFRKLDHRLTFTRCTKRIPQYKLVKKRGRNETLRKGVDLGPISTFSQSGWSTSTKWSVHVKRKSFQCWLGSDGPASSSRVVYVKFRKGEDGPCGRTSDRCRLATGNSTDRMR